MGLSGVDIVSQGNSAAFGAAGKVQALSSKQQAKVRELQARDQEVRQHEQAHIAAGDGYVEGGARYTYTTGPDGKQYATGGEVSINTSPAATPQQTVAKMEVVMRAALAPANPSAQDRAVYAEAAKAEAQAKTEEQRAASNPDSNSPSAENTGVWALQGAQNIAMAALQKALVGLQLGASAPTVNYQA